MSRRSFLVIFLAKDDIKFGIFYAFLLIFASTKLYHEIQIDFWHLKWYGKFSKLQYFDLHMQRQIYVRYEFYVKDNSLIKSRISMP